MLRVRNMVGLSVVIAAVGLFPGIAPAQTAVCPEVSSARQVYLSTLNALKLNDENSRPPRALAGFRREEARRGDQSVQQAPRGDQSVQQAPRSTQEAPRANLEKASGLIADADAACQTGRAGDAAWKANEARRLLE